MIQITSNFPTNFDWVSKCMVWIHRLTTINHELLMTLRSAFIEWFKMVVFCIFQGVASIIWYSICRESYGS